MNNQNLDKLILEIQEHQGDDMNEQISQEEMIDVIGQVWNKFPELRLTQLLLNVLPNEIQAEEIYYLENTDLMKLLKQYVENHDKE